MILVVGCRTVITGDRAAVVMLMLCVCCSFKIKRMMLPSLLNVVDL